MRKENDNIRSDRFKKTKCPVSPDKTARSSSYNYTDMRDETDQVFKGFAHRLSELRNAKAISAREMSLSLGQGAGYINNIENANNLPSMAMFFEICEFLDISPREFFSYVKRSTQRKELLLNEFEELDDEAQDLIIALTRLIRKKEKQ